MRATRSSVTARSPRRSTSTRPDGRSANRIGSGRATARARRSRASSSLQPPRRRPPRAWAARSAPRRSRSDSSGGSPPGCVGARGARASASTACASAFRVPAGESRRVLRRGGVQRGTDGGKAHASILIECPTRCRAQTIGGNSRHTRRPARSSMARRAARRGTPRRLGASVAKHKDAGKLLARERAEKLCDPGSFVEPDRYVRHRESNFGMLERRPYGDAVVTGYGRSSAGACSSSARTSPSSAGRSSEVFAEKICKVMELAAKYGCPVIGINDSGGARIQEGVVSLAGYAEIFWRNVQGSGVDPADLARHGAVRGRRRLFAGDDRLHPDGRGHARTCSSPAPTS